MATTYYTLLTLAGKAKIANAVALGQVVNLTHMAIGDGNGNPTTPSEGQTALVREVYRGSITRLTVDPLNANYVIAELAVPSNVGGWTAREIGVFDADGNLFCVANFAATYKPQISEGTLRDLVIRVVMEVSNSSVVTLMVDPNVVIASRAWVIDNFGLAGLLPGGLTNQIATKASNADGDIEWRDPGEFTYLVNAQIEEQVLADDQVIVDPAQISTQGLALYVEGAREFDFTVTSPTRITLGRSYPAGTRIWMCQNDALSQITDASVARTGTPPLFTGAGTVKEALDLVETALKNVNSTEPFGKNLDNYTTAGLFRVSGLSMGPEESNAPLYTTASIIVVGNIQILIAEGKDNPSVAYDSPILWVRILGGVELGWRRIPSWGFDSLILSEFIAIRDDGKFFADREIIPNAGILVSKKTLKRKKTTNANYTYDADDAYALYVFFLSTVSSIFSIPRATGSGNSFQAIIENSTDKTISLYTPGVTTTWNANGVFTSGNTFVVTGGLGMVTIVDVDVDLYSISN